MEKLKRIIVRSISKKFRLGFKKRRTLFRRVSRFLSGIEPQKEIWSLKDVSFEVDAGEIIGIIGSNGSGKSTLLRTIAGIYAPDGGKVKTCGKLLPLINLGAGMSDRLSMEDNIYLCCSLFGLGRKAIKKRINSIAKFADLEDFMETKLYQFSSGMFQRLAFSIAMHCNPEILLLDEVFEVGDESFRKKSEEKLKELVKNGATIVLVTHSLDSVKNKCHKAIWLDKGEIMKIGDAKRIVGEYIRFSKEKALSNEPV